MDAVTAFLNGDVVEELYMEIRKDLRTRENEGKVWPLLKSLYGLKQACRNWHDSSEDHFISRGFRRLQSDHCIYVKENVFVAVYVDDFVFLGPKHLITIEKEAISKAFEMIDLGEAHFVLGIEIVREPTGVILLSQAKYAHDLLRKYNMHESKAVATPLEPGVKLTKRQENEAPLDPDIPYRSVLGSISYLMTGTRPDLAFAAHFPNT